jgi:hypothetical protein
MRTFFLAISIFALIEGFGGSAFAVERGEGWGTLTNTAQDGGAVIMPREIDPGWTTPIAASVPKPPCTAIAKLKSHFDAHTHWTALSPGQFHFIEGVYVGSPSTPEGLPPGDGALLAQHDSEKDGVIVWTRGPLACMPLPIPEKLIKIISSIKTGALDDDGNEL